MTLKELLLNHKVEILKTWLHLILETYPADGSNIFEREKDRFANPVGHTLSSSMGALYEGLLQEKTQDQLSDPLEKVIQIRSVQDFSPSQAVMFVLLLKRAVLEEIKRSGTETPQGMEGWFDFDSRIDRLSLRAFDLFMKYRERVYDIRITEVKKERDRALTLLERTR